MRQRLPLVLSATALLVAVLGATPVGEAAWNAVPFARNAARVNGIPASRSPRANHLLPLGPNRQFPRSVVPRGPAGPQGPQGPQGPAGAPATKLFAVVNADGTIYKSSGVDYVTRTATGNYIVSFTRYVDDCAAVASTGGRKIDDTHFTIDEGMASASTINSFVYVHTRIPGGFNPFASADRSFHLAVFCPS